MRRESDRHVSRAHAARPHVSLQIRKPGPDALTSPRRRRPGPAGAGRCGRRRSSGVTSSRPRALARAGVPEVPRSRRRDRLGCAGWCGRRPCLEHLPHPQAGGRESAGSPRAEPSAPRPRGRSAEAGARVPPSPAQPHAGETCESARPLVSLGRSFWRKCYSSF